MGGERKREGETWFLILVYCWIVYSHQPSTEQSFQICMWTLLSTTWRRVSLTLKQLRKEAVHSFFEIINWSWSSAPCFRVPILCTEQHSTPSGLHLFDKRQVRHMWGQEKPNCIHLARFMRFLLSFFPTGPQTNHITSISISIYIYI